MADNPLLYGPTPSGRCFTYFMLLFALGCLALAFEFHPIISTSAVVVIYTGLLYLAQNGYKLILSATTKNSPYFLGFLFTLTALLKIFISLPDQSTNMIAYLNASVIPDIGTALLSTVLGLVGRQLMLTSDPSEERQEEILNRVTNELRSAISSYRGTQRRMLEVLEGFHTTHTSFLEEEVRTTKVHVTTLAEASKALRAAEESFKNFPMAASGLVEDATERLRDGNARFVKSVESELHGVIAEVQGLKDEITRTARDFKECNDLIGRDLKDSLNRVGESFQRTSDSIGEANRAFEEVSVQSRRAMRDIGGKYSELMSDIENSADIHKSRVRRFKRELDEIDELIDTFIRVTSKRMKLNE